MLSLLKRSRKLFGEVRRKLGMGSVRLPQRPAGRRRSKRQPVPTEVPDGVCPLCGSTSFIEFRGRPLEKCAGCDAPVRTRMAWLLLRDYVKIGPSSRIAHFAPEASIERAVKAIGPADYRKFDINEARYPAESAVEHCDMCRDLHKLPQGYFDVVIHNHVLEHVPCNYTVVLQRLHGLLRPGGMHVFSFPVQPGRYRENLSSALTSGERKKAFGQGDHMRRFGRDDFEDTAGMVFGIGRDYSVANFIPPATLAKAVIPQARWTLERGPVFVVAKQ
jgi:SAM-dependent methyltransferase